MGQLSTVIAYLSKAGQAAPSADNSQPWAFGYDNGHLIVKLVDDVSGQGLALDHPAVLLSLGCATENIVQASKYIGVSEPDAEYFPEKSCVHFRITSENLNLAINDEAYSQPLFERHTNRFAFLKDPLPEPIKLEAASLTQCAATVKIFDTPQDIKFLAGLVKISAQARFQSKDIHEWLGNSLRLSEKAALSGDGLDARTIDLPPGGKQLLALTRPWSRMNLLNKLGLYKLFAGVESIQVKQGACLVGVCAPLATRGIFDAGMLLERVWIFLNQAGFAVHPYFVLSDQIFRFHEGLVPEHLQKNIACVVDDMAKKGFDGDNHLQILLRVGRAKVDPFRSKRRKVSKLTA